MTIDEAIKELANMLIACENLKYHDTPDALKLGIEGLKLIQRERLLSINPVETQLVGETLPGETIG